MKEITKNGPATEILGSLTAAEESQRDTLERQIVDGWNDAARGFTKMGSALKVIHAEKLYRSTHASFEEYTKDRWNVKYHQAMNLIKSSDVAKHLTLAGDILVQPTAERQARPLASLDSPAEQAEAWKDAVEQAGGGQPSHTQVEAATKRTKTRKVQGQAEDAERERAARTAPDPAPADEGQSVAEIAAERKRERRLTDEEFLAACPAHAKLPEKTQRRFAIEALAYRRVEPSIAKFREAVRPTIHAAKKTLRSRGAFLGLVDFFLGLEDPRGWDVCRKCKGEGATPAGDDEAGETVKCDHCAGHGYRVK